MCAQNILKVKAVHINMKMRLLLIDNNDSFTYNIVDILRTIKGCHFDVVKSSLLLTDIFHLYDKIIISPGPGKPSEFPAIEKTIEHSIRTGKSLLGICLGHQAVCEYFGGELVRLKEAVHGQKKTIAIDNTSPIFKNLPAEIEAGLYHSWAVNYSSLPSCLRITGKTYDEGLMSVQHVDFDIHGLQFHPESFITDYGKQMIENFLKA